MNDELWQPIIDRTLGILIEHQQDKITRLESRIEAAVPYMVHLGNCDADHEAEVCTCGLYEWLAADDKETDDE